MVIPTYNNEKTILQVVKNVLKKTNRLIVVNDGSTDSTAQLLQSIPHIEVVAYEQNQGKGHALKMALRKAKTLGYDYMIVLDSDGQHYPEDLSVFLNKLDETPGALIIGSRNLNQENVPQKSNFGNRFSSFWYRVETGINLPDTQSGYRLYPISPLADWKYFTKKYEFEIEIIVRAAWANVPVVDVPIQVYYPPAGERVSHFRPFKDFTRISLLNTVLVLIMLFWIKPRNFFLQLTSKDGRKKIWATIFNHPEESSHLKAASIGFGIFMGIVPIWGFQLAVGIPLAILFRLNKALFILAANISVFPPLIWLASLATGKIILGQKEWNWSLKGWTLEKVKQEGVAFFLGGAVLAVVLGIVFYVVSLFIIKWYKRKKPNRKITPNR